MDLLESLKRSDYIDGETKVIEELKSINKPFIVILNTTHTDNPDTLKIKMEIEEKHGVKSNSFKC